MNVPASSKPELVDQLRATWRKSSEHLAEQVQRFIRLTIIAAIPSLSSLLAGGHFDYKTLLAFILPFAEVAFRQVWPALGAKRADSADGVTIVPDEVCGPQPLTGVVDPPSDPIMPTVVHVPPSALDNPKPAPAKKATAKKAPAKKVAPKKK